ncbi:MAG: hypothetical protein PHF21_01435 [Bacilli bacterium]|nr:hypothetical protein [Bacilli bacterium]
MFNIDKDKETFVVGFDYDGVITKRGSSGENEEKWLNREKNFIWRKFLNLVSSIYNKYFSLNKEIIELTKTLKSLGCSIVIISSHTLTTTNYKESKKTRARVKKRLIKNNILFDDIFFIAGNKVDICHEIGVNLMIEDNIDKVKALKDSGIKTIAKKTDKNYHLLTDDLHIVKNLLELINIIRKELDAHQIINNFKNNFSSKNLTDYSKEIIRDSNKPPLLATFDPLPEENILMDLDENLAYDKDKPLTLKKKLK